MKALILLSHGSRRKESNDEMISLANRLNRLPDHPFKKISCAFQQFARPSFQDSLAAMVAQGAAEIVVFPLFLACGNHVLIDVPEMMQAARTEFPHLSITVMPHLGQVPGFADFLIRQAAGAIAAKAAAMAQS